ncbi:MAG: hypothetical protein NTV79_09115 [Candidatus Aureabacteria bacterium]|nr:hypothetical protein [Candidatus Auribacterota bacterium]
MARVLSALGSERASDVNGRDVHDEITLASATVESELKEGTVRTFHLDPSEYGLKICRPEELKGGDAVENARIIREILEGKTGPRRDVAVLNAAAAIMLGGGASDLAQGIARAQEAISSGNALRKLEELKRLSK